MIEIFGTTYYVLPWSIMVFFVAGFFVLTLSLLLIKKRWYVRFGVGFVGIIGVGVAIFWDVYLIGQEVDRLCKEEGGLHVYKTVRANGFLGGLSIKPWADYGFEYVEHGNREYDSENKKFYIKKYRATMENGHENYEAVDNFVSTYGLDVNPNVQIEWPREYSDIKSNNRITRIRHFTVNLNTGEVLGELVYFKIYPGRVDGYFGARIGFSYTPWFCGNKKAGATWGMGPSSVVQATIKPISTQGDNI